MTRNRGAFVTVLRRAPLVLPPLRPGWLGAFIVQLAVCASWTVPTHAAGVKKPAEESVDESGEEPPEEIPEQREAPHVAESPEEEAPHVVEVPEEREPSRVSLGVRGFGGVVRQAGEYSPVYGGGVLFGVPLVGRIELEASAMVARKDDDSAFLFAEVIGKWVVETESSLSPHLSFGPVVSFDFTKPVEASGGLLLGGGATYWIIPRVGAILDVNYRLLFGAEVTHVGTAALGVVFRPF